MAMVRGPVPTTVDRSDLVAAVDADDLAGDAAAVVTGEQRRHACQLVRLEHPALQTLRRRSGFLFRLTRATDARDALEVDHRGVRPPGTEHVGVDAMRRHGLGKLLRESDETVFGGGVGKSASRSL